MILKELLKSRKLNSEARKFMKENKQVWDIAIYGSTLKGKLKANDIDFALILKNANEIEKKEELAYLFRKKIEFLGNVDVKSVSIQDFLDINFLARQAILAESFLLKRKKYLSKLLGFDNYYIFNYSLKDLSSSKKTIFLYALKGRRTNKGLIETENLKILGTGSLLVPVTSSEIIKEFLEKHNINYKIVKVLIYR